MPGTRGHLAERQLNRHVKTPGATPFVRHGWPCVEGESENGDESGSDDLGAPLRQRIRTWHGELPGGALRVVVLLFERRIRHDNSPFSVMRPRERIAGLDRNGNRSSLWMDSIFARKENAIKVLSIQFRTRFDWRGSSGKKTSGWHNSFCLHPPSRAS